MSFAKLPLPWLWQSYLPAYEYNVTFHVSFFDPVPALGASAAFRGHNLFPWSQGPASNGSIWYAATRGGFPPANEKNRYLQSYDFAKLFDHVLKP